MSRESGTSTVRGNEDVVVVKNGTPKHRIIRGNCVVREWRRVLGAAKRQGCGLGSYDSSAEVR